MTNLIAKMNFPKQGKTRRFGLVLIHLENKNKFGEQYLTSIKYLDGDREAESGIYFTTLAAAMVNFGQRCAPYIAVVAAVEMQERKAKDLNEGEGI